MNMPEEEAIILIEPYLEQRCKGRWCTLELEDRLAEARFAFLAAWRSLPTNTGHFLQDFDNVLVLHMKEVLHQQGQWLYSLDAPLGATGCNGYTFRTAPAFDESGQYVHDFLSKLPWEDYSIMRALLDGYSKAEIARKTGLSAYQLNKKLQAIGTRYCDEYLCL